MDIAAQFAALAELLYGERFCHLTVQTPYDDKTIKSLFCIGVNFHHPIDLADTQGLDWREVIIRCLKSVYPRSRTQPDPDPRPQLPSTAKNLPEPATRIEPVTTVPTFALQPTQPM